MPAGVRDEAVKQVERLVRLVVVAEVPVVAHDLRAAKPVEHGPALLVVAAVRVAAGVDEVDVSYVGPDRGPVIVLLQDWFVLGVGSGAVASDQDRLMDPHVEMLQERE